MRLFPGPGTALLAVDTLAMLVAAWAFAFWNRRGLWRPLGETTSMYLAVARLHCRRRLTALRFAEVILVAQIVVVAVWRLWGPGVPIAGVSSIMALVIPAVVIVGFVEVIAWNRRRTVAELAELDRLVAFD